MFRRSLAVVFAVGFAIIIVIGPSSDSLAQTKNNLVPNQTGAPATPADTAKKQPPANNSTTVAAEPEYPDPTVVKTLSNVDLDLLFDRMATHFSKDAVLFNNVGAAYFQRKDYANAENAIRRAIMLNNHPAFLVNLSIIYDTQNRYPEALTAAQRAVNQAPKYVRAKTQVCELLLVMKQNADTVICYDELAKFTTLDAYSQTLDAVAYQRTGNADKTISIISPLIQQPNPTALMYNTLGYAYFMKKKYRQAVDTFKQGTEIDPDSPALRYNLAIALESINDHGGALMQYSLMKNKDPNLADTLYRGLNRDKIIYVDEATAPKKRKAKM